jgi:hypothetical protein
MTMPQSADDRPRPRLRLEPPTPGQIVERRSVLADRHLLALKKHRQWRAARKARQTAIEAATTKSETEA